MSVQLIKEDALARIVISCEETKNGLGTNIGNQLLAALKDLKHSYPDEIRAATLEAQPSNNSNHGKTWIAGGDLKELSTIDSVGALAYVSLYKNIAQAISELPVPLIGLVEGDAIGGGAELASWCDLRIVTNDSRFIYKQTSIGLATGYGGCARLVELVGLSQAQKILLLGSTLTSDELYDLGLAHFVAKDAADARHILKNCVARVSTLSRSGVATQKKMLGLGTTFTRIASENQIFKDNWRNEDHESFLGEFKNRKSK